MADFSISDLFGNKNFQSLLAGIGTNLDPQGVGGAIGRPTQQMIQSVASQEAVAADAKRRKEQFDQLMKILSGQFTPKDQPGPTSMKMDGDKITLDITNPSSLAAGTGGASAPSGTISPVGGGGFKLSDVLPFF